jgi:hypothetical protein
VNSIHAVIILYLHPTIHQKKLTTLYVDVEVSLFFYNANELHKNNFLKQFHADKGALERKHRGEKWAKPRGGDDDNLGRITRHNIINAASGI